MLGKLFSKRKKLDEVWLAPLTGELVNIEEVPDPTFSEKMMGEGLAIKPTEGKVLSPVDGEIIQVFPTKHAIGIRSANGAEILIHIGLETVSLDGEPFELHVSDADKVQAGQLLVSFDLEEISNTAANTITPIVLTNGDSIENLVKKENCDVQAGKTEIVSYQVNN
ncbi:PTS sugar transporter subunit IIA [Gracilibacillus sp. HCP3S3_G5_1]|uniref:PTS sugar transporter subunit IIA n=1 Tax=unclassified Gracilibacillus TaxID=2625209 RepID=UPI003F8BB53C